MEEFIHGLMVTVIGMGVTFLALIVLSFILDVFRILAEGPSSKNEVEEIKQTTIIENEIYEEISNEEDDLELIAVITAAIAASLETSTDQLRIRSFKRINSNSSPWNRVGRMSQAQNNLY
jgi:sodium pump decarboxylase gamma subunit